ncbi:MAG: TRAP transporter small permease [Tabrizicola sp.]
MLYRVSALWARIEIALAALLALAVSLLILLNVITRNIGAALFWVDELAIYAMVWMTFIGASAAIHFGHSIVITLVTDTLPAPVQRAVMTGVDAVLLGFALAMVWFCWIWYAPLDLLRHGFDTEAFQAATFNFIYAEPTSTLGIAKFWVWLVMWVFALGATLHSLANLVTPIRDKTKS